MTNEHDIIMTFRGQERDFESEKDAMLNILYISDVYTWF